MPTPFPRYERHPASALMPDHSPEDFAALKKDIEINGQHDPILLLNDKILDGWHRYLACEELGKTPITAPADAIAVRDPAGFVYSKHVHRNLNPTQKACAAVDIEGFVSALKESEYSALRKYGAALMQRDQNGLAEKLFGSASARYVAYARSLRKDAPDLYADCARGKKKITQATSELRRRQKLATLQVATASTPAASVADIDIRTGDCLSGMTDIVEKEWTEPYHINTPGAQIRRTFADLVFADSPYNIGIDYGDGAQADSIDPVDFQQWCGEWIVAGSELLSHKGTFIIVINWENMPALTIAAQDAGLDLVNVIVWYETFGTNCPERFNRTSRPILYFAKNEHRRTFNRAAVTRASDRQIKYNDKRASAGGKNLDDVWTDIPRLVTNASERIPGFPTQLPLALVRRCIEFATNPGDLVIDPFVGSGTTPHACLLTGRRFLGWERNAAFADLARQRIQAAASIQSPEPKVLSPEIPSASPAPPREAA